MPAGDGKGRRILVVDDEADIVNLLVEILTREGHQADTAPNGSAALTLVEGHEYDLILCDLRMPVLDGPGFYRELQRRRPRLPKPFSVPEIREIVARALSDGQAEPS